MLIEQINNIKIVYRRYESRPYQCITPAGDTLSKFIDDTAARRWCFSQHAYLAPRTVRYQIATAWRVLEMPKLDHVQIVIDENGRWFVTGIDSFGTGGRRTFRAIEDYGPHTSFGFYFKEQR